jgi:hypothetical protein
MSRIKSYLPVVRKVIWAGFLISLPVTNFRYFSGFLGGSKIQVLPLLVIPMAVLLLLELPRLWKRKLPRNFLPLILFLIFAVVSSSIPFVLGNSSHLSEVTYFSRAIRTFITLALGFAIYVTVSITPLDREDLNFTLKWLYAGLAIALIWGSLQIIFVLELIPGWYVFMSKIQHHISMNAGTPDRIMGLTLEPSWFADQISALWLPWVLPAVLLNRTVFKKRWGWFTIETFLLAWMLFVLLFTLSRSGLAVSAVVLGAGFLFFRIKKSVDHRKIRLEGAWGKIVQYYYAIPKFIRVSALTLLLLGGISATIYYIGKDNKYINRMWLYWIQYDALKDTIGSRSLSGFFRYIGFGPRFVYWETAFREFQTYPLLGVGLGNYTFHFQESLPAVQVGYMPEILTRIVPDHIRVVTAKIYLIRLLAETGLLGTGAYVTFLITLASGGFYLWLSDDLEKKFWGAGSILGLIAFLVDTFSYDSLAIPNPWVVFGLITCAVSVYSNQNSPKEGRPE